MATPFRIYRILCSTPPDLEAERLAFHWCREGGGESWVEWTLDAVADGTRLTVIETAAPAGPLLAAAAWRPRLRSLALVFGRLVLA